MPAQNPSPIEPSVSGAPFAVTGELLIQNVSEWHGRLAAPLAAGAIAAIDLGGLTAIDLFGLQLLGAAQLAATRGGRPLTFTRIPPCVEAACAAAGINRATFLAP